MPVLPLLCSQGPPSSALAAVTHAALRRDHGIEVPVACAGGRMWCRISAQVYNDLSGGWHASIAEVARGARVAWFTEGHRTCAAAAGGAGMPEHKSLPLAPPVCADYQKLADAVKQLAAGAGALGPAAVAPP